MSGKLRERNSSGLTDLARLQDIRRELLLTDREEDDVFLANNQSPEAVSVVEEIVADILRKVVRNNSGYRQEELRQKRCTTLDDKGNEVLCCVLQTPSHTHDPSGVSCDVIDPLHVPRITRKHERLISHVIRFTATYISQFAAEQELAAVIPIAKGLVQSWQEVIIKQLNKVSGNWTNNEDPVDVITIDDNGESIYGVHLPLRGPVCVAAVARPRTDRLTLGDLPYTVTASADTRVKVKVPPSSDPESVAKHMHLQVVPVDDVTLNAFRQSKEQDIDITAATSLIVMKMSGYSPETVTFSTKCVKSRKEETKTPDTVKRPTLIPSREATMNSPQTPRRANASDPTSNAAPTPRTKDYVPVSTKSVLQSRLRDIALHRSSTMVPVTRNNTSVTLQQTGDSATRRSMSITPRHSITTIPRKLPDAGDKRPTLDMHLVQIGEDSEVRLKLLEDTDKGKSEAHKDDIVTFSVYDRKLSLLAIETKSGLQYNKIQALAQEFTNFVVKHKVILKVGQDIRNVNSVTFAMTRHPPGQYGDKAKGRSAIGPKRLSTALQIDEGDLVGVVFRGNVVVANQTKRVFSFHGFTGINKIFDIKVGDSFSQRSLNNFHGGLDVYTLSEAWSGVGPEAVHDLEAGTPGAGWELRAEFPLVLPKYKKKTPVTVIKAPVSLRFQEPLTLDFLRKVCRDLVGDWSQFARSLGTTHARLQAIKQQNRNVVSERMLMDVVVGWMKIQPVSRDKVPPILHALTKCGKWKLAEELTHRHESLSNHRSAEMKDKQVQKAISLVCNSKHVTGKWQQLFRHLLVEEEKSEEELKQHVVAIETKYENEASRCHGALSWWKTEAKTAPSVWKLVDALRYCNCDVAADSLTVVESPRA